jgi:pimeloyl-ACP methyl ester carboxylesterase
VTHFSSYDGTQLCFHVTGGGPPLVCLPGGPGRASEYLGDLGGLSTHRTLLRLDLRGTGGSAHPTDPATLRVDRLVDDVEAFRVELGLERMDLLAHSAGSVLATLYAARYPHRLSCLVLITPGLAAVGVAGSPDSDALLRRSEGEPWYPEAVAALAAIRGGDLSMNAFAASRPLFYRRWNAASQRHATLGVSEGHLDARLGYFADLELDIPDTVRALHQAEAPTVLLIGDLDPLVTPAMADEAAPSFNDPTVFVQNDAGHFPWVDDPRAFTNLLEVIRRRAR